MTNVITMQASGYHVSPRLSHTYSTFRMEPLMSLPKLHLQIRDKRSRTHLATLNLDIPHHYRDGLIVLDDIEQPFHDALNAFKESWDQSMAKAARHEPQA